MSPDVVRVESNGSLAMANGTIQIPYVLQSPGQINMGLRAVAAQGQRRPQVAYAFLRFRTKAKPQAVVHPIVAGVALLGCQHQPPARSAPFFRMQIKKVVRHSDRVRRSLLLCLRLVCQAKKGCRIPPQRRPPADPEGTGIWLGSRQDLVQLVLLQPLWPLLPLLQRFAKCAITQVRLVADLK